MPPLPPLLPLRRLPPAAFQSQSLILPRSSSGLRPPSRLSLLQLRRRPLSSSSPQAADIEAGQPLVANGLEMTSLFVPSLDGKHRLHVKRVGDG